VSVTGSTGRAHALVLGGSVAGMCVAQALSGFFEQVTIVDRDVLSTDGAIRKAVPQGAQLHLLLSRGAAEMEALFPGLLQELTERGAPEVPDFSTVHMNVGGHLQCRTATLGVPTRMPSRPFLEGRVRARLAGNVTIRQQTEVTGLLGSGRTVTGARVRSGEQVEELGAGLVVDATGRSGRAVTWLRDLGVPAPAEEFLDVDIVYSAATARMPVPPGRDRRSTPPPPRSAHGAWESSTRRMITGSSAPTVTPGTTPAATTNPCRHWPNPAHRPTGTRPWKPPNGRPRSWRCITRARCAAATTGTPPCRMACW
jgi:2-polyprenyl-6-methoxyphenol hydroxylase-like FAD-dependent oxidoreductase